MTDFTKGKWEAGSGQRSDPKTTVYSDDVTGSAIADCFLKWVARSQTEMEANAHLIAAAPDMYEALEEIFNKPLESVSRPKIARILQSARGEHE